MPEEPKPKMCPCERCNKAWNEVERMRNLLEDVVNVLDLSDYAIDKYGPLGAEPSELVELVLRQKDLKIAFLIATHNKPQGLPDWFIKLVTKELYRLKALSEDKSLYIDARTRCDAAYRKLDWVLSLKPPVEQEVYL